MFQERKKNKHDSIVLDISRKLKLEPKLVELVIEFRNKWTYNKLLLGYSIRWRYFGVFKPKNKNTNE